MEMILIKIRNHHDDQSYKTTAPYQNEIKVSKVFSLRAAKGVIDRWGAASGNHEANTSVVKANKEGHYLFRVAVALMIHRTKPKTTYSTCKV